MTNTGFGWLVADAGGVLLVAIAILLFVEGRLLRMDQAPETAWTRWTIRRWFLPSLMVGFVAIFGLGLLTAHFYWDAACG